MCTQPAQTCKNEQTWKAHRRDDEKKHNIKVFKYQIDYCTHKSLYREESSHINHPLTYNSTGKKNPIRRYNNILYWKRDRYEILYRR